MSQPRFLSTRSHVAAGIAAMALVLGVALPAAAEATFPAAVQKEVGSTCSPQCTLCHTTETGGRENLKPNPLTTDGYMPRMLPGGRGEGSFIANLMVVNNHKLPSSDVSIQGALKLMAKMPCNSTGPQPCDSDGDGMIDTDELKKDRDPDNANDKDGDLCVGPKYGCGATISALPRESSATREAAAVMSLLGVGLVLLRRARRR